MPTIEVWLVLSEDGSYEVATDEQTALDRLVDAADEDLAGTVCRIVKLNVTMADTRTPADEDETEQADKAVDVTVPDDAGSIVEVEIE
jgi:hypothetical protein